MDRQRSRPPSVRSRAPIDWHREQYAELLPSRPLFPSRKGTAALLRTAAHEILKKAFNAEGLNGKLATHSMRKSYAQRLYEAMGDMYAVQVILGHQNVTTTQAYLAGYSLRESAGGIGANGGGGG